MRSIVTNRAALYVGRFVTPMSPAETAEPIEMPFGLWARMVPVNHVVRIIPWEGAILRERGVHCKISAVNRNNG